MLLRLEKDSSDSRAEQVRIAEAFVDDMDAYLRQAGIGDFVVGKHVGRMMAALGGRIAAFRDSTGDGYSEAVRRNLFHEAPPSEGAVDYCASRLRRFREALDAQGIEPLLTGELPRT